MIDVQAADAPGLFAAPSGVSFGLVRPGHAETRTVELERRGRRRRRLDGERARARGARDDRRARGRDADARAHAALPPRSSVGNRSGNIVLTSGTHTVHIRWWGYVERPRLAKVHARHAARPGAGSRATRARARRARAALPLAGRARAAAVCRASTRDASSCGRSSCPRGARNAGVEADGAVVPQILLARDENRLAGEPALPSNGNPYLETYGRFERVSGLLVPGPGPLLRRRRDAAGPQAGPLPAAPLDQRPHAAGDQRDHAHVIGRDADAADVPRRRRAAAASARPTSSCASTARRRTSRSPPAATVRVRVGAALEPAGTASRSRPPTCRRRRTPRTHRPSRCRTRAPCTRRSPWARPASLQRDGSL